MHFRSEKGINRRGERGQATLLFLFCMIGFAVLTVFLINTGSASSRKIEMQGASDAAAMAAGVRTARGMNLMVLNNKGMADLLGVMITIRSMKATALQMPLVLEPIIDGLTLIPEPSSKAIAAQLRREQTFWGSFGGELETVDERVNAENGGVGWSWMMRLDVANQQVKSHFLAGLPNEVIRFARSNGADAPPYAIAMTGSDSSKPTFPVGRGSQEYIAANAGSSTSILSESAKKVFVVACGASPTSGPVCFSPFLAWPILDANINDNLRHLSRGRTRPQINKKIPVEYLSNLRNKDGESLTDILDRYNLKQAHTDPNFQAKKPQDYLHDVGFGLGDQLEWPSSTPPRPMMLTGKPQADADAVIQDTEDTVDIFLVRRHLQMLVFARGRLAPALGSNYFQNEDTYGLLTYGQAQVYNPKDWYMFNQHWQAKLVRAELLNSKWRELARTLGITASADGGSVIAYANTH
jgi:hypothetical protein